MHKDFKMFFAYAIQGALAGGDPTDEPGKLVRRAAIAAEEACKIIDERMTAPTKVTRAA